MIKQVNHTGTGANHSKPNSSVRGLNSPHEIATKSNAATNEAEAGVAIKRSQSNAKKSGTPSLNNSRLTFPDEKDKDGKDNKPLVLGSNDKTINTTVKVKLGLDPIANRLNNRSLAKVSPYTKVDYTNAKERLIKDYLSGISMEHCCNRDSLQIEKGELYKNYESNSKKTAITIYTVVNLLENWIQKIKSKEFNMNDKEYTNKKEAIVALIEKIKEIRAQISTGKRGISTNKIYKYSEQISKCKERVEKSKTQNDSLIQRIELLKKEIPTNKSQTEKEKEEMKKSNEAMAAEEGEIGKLNVRIQEMTKKIADVTKDKEASLASITSIRKQIEACRMKINNSFTKATSFMLHVNDLVEKLDLF